MREAALRVFGGSAPGRGNCQCKAPEAGGSLQQVSTAPVKQVKGKGRRRGQRSEKGTGLSEDLGLYSEWHRSHGGINFKCQYSMNLSRLDLSCMVFRKRVFKSSHCGQALCHTLHADYLVYYLHLSKGGPEAPAEVNLPKVAGCYMENQIPNPGGSECWPCNPHLKHLRLMPPTVTSPNMTNADKGKIHRLLGWSYKLIQWILNLPRSDKPEWLASHHCAVYFWQSQTKKSHSWQHGPCLFWLWRPRNLAQIEICVCRG